MVNADKIGWGHYGGFEGPYYSGAVHYVLAATPDENDRRLRVLTATESGAYDAVNMYDQCIISIGLIQWCESQYYLSSKLLHSVAEAGCADVIQTALAPALTACKASFKKNPTGQWRFFFDEPRDFTIDGKTINLPAGEVNSSQRQQALFLGCDGKLNSWSDENKAQAKLWAACMANIWSDTAAQVAHVSYTKQRLMGFVLPASKTMLWDGTPDSGWQGVMRAAFISFAGNNPNLANVHLLKAAGELKSAKWSPEWCTGVLKEMTFGPNVAIYSTRYDKIRPLLEQLWTDITLPKTAIELKVWQEPDPKPVDASAHIAEPVTPIPSPESVTPVPPEQIITVPFPAAVAQAPSSGGILAFLLKLITTLLGLFSKK